MNKKNNHHKRKSKLKKNRGAGLDTLALNQFESQIVNRESYLQSSDSSDEETKRQMQLRSELASLNGLDSGNQHAPVQR